MSASTVFLTDPAPSAAVLPGSRQRFLSHILVGRMLVLCGVFLVLSLVEPRQSWGFYIFATLSFLVFLPYTFWIRNHRHMVDIVSYQFLLDVVITTGIINYTGGLDSPFFALYPLIILAAGIVVSGALAAKVTVLSMVMYSLMALLEYHGVIGPLDGSGAVLAHEFRSIMISRNLLFILFGGGSIYLAGYISWQTNQIEGYAALLGAILDHIPVGLVTVRPDRGIGLLNRTALQLLGKEISAVVGRPVDEIFAGPVPALDAERVVRCQLATTTGDIDVACEVVKTLVPDLFLRDSETGRLVRGRRKLKVDPGHAEVSIMAIRDIRAELAAAKASEEIMRLRTTIQVVNELAHHVRNSLTAIHGASYLTSEMINVPSDPSGQLTAAERQTVHDMSNIVTEQVELLDQKICEFLMGAAENPAEVARQAAAFYEEYFGARGLKAEG